MKKTTLGLVLSLFTSYAQASTPSTASRKLMRSLLSLLRNNKTVLAALQRSDIARRKPAHNGYTKCLVGNPYNTCEATPCTFCKDINIPPKNDNRIKKK